MLNTKTRKLLGASASAIALALPLGAGAQEAGQEGDEIIVTGSRIAVDNATEAVSPVVSIGVEDIASSGQLDIATLLRESPALQASLPGSFSAFNGGALGVGQLNLRDLGTERTLVLEDGRRHVPGVQGTGAVDVNTISTSLLSRVEILTGGASSIYGADAVSGVVNFVLRDAGSFDGLEVRAQAGVSDEGDAEEWFLSVANGWEFDDGRGDFVFGVEYNHTEPVLAGDRDFAGSGLATFVQNGPTISEFLGISEDFSNTFITNRTLPISSAFGIISLGTENDPPSAFLDAALSGGVPGCGRPVGAQGFPGCQVFDNGVLRPYNPADIFIGPFEAIGGDAVPTDPDLEIILPESDRFLFQTATSYEIVPNLTFFANAKFVYTETLESNQVNGFNDDIPIAIDNPFIPDALRAQIDALIAEGETPLLAVSRDTLDLNALPNPVAERTTFRLVGGFKGELPGLGFDYEVSYNYGRTDADITNQRTRIEDRFFAAIDAAIDPDTGEIVCRSDFAADPSIPGPSFPSIPGTFSTFQPGDGQCVPLNIFGQNAITEEAADFAFLPTVSSNKVVQKVFFASVSGDTGKFFELPAGPIGFALGVEDRQEEGQFLPDGLVQSGLTFGSNNSGPTFPSGGEYAVTEGFGEVKIPVLSGLPFFEFLEVNGAYRYSDYDTIGITNTWTGGGRWAPIDTLTFRGSVSRAVRAPNITELFSPLQPDSIGATSDPCNPQFINAGSQFREQNCLLFVNPGFDSTQAYVDGDGNVFPGNSAFVPGQSGGNTELFEETADTWTVGAVWQPSGALQDLRVIVDYYDITIEGLIATLLPFDIAQNCVDLPTINNQFCDQIFRAPREEGGFIEGFRSGEINLGSVETAGIDFTVDYQFPVSAIFKGRDLGDLKVSALGTHFLKNEEVRDPASPEEVTDVQGIFTNPDWIVNFRTTWRYQNLELGWRGRLESSQLLPGIELDDLASDPNFSDRTETGSAFVNDFSASYTINEDFEIYGGVNNAFDRDPFLATLSRPAGPRGRFMFIGVNAKF